MRVTVLALWVGLVVAVTAVPAEAEPKRARAAFNRGNKLYNLGKFNQALKAFEEAYLEKENPVFLFNIGQCHRQAGHGAEALRAYRAYLRVAPDAANRPEVERRIQELDAQSHPVPAPPPPGTGISPAPPLPGPPLPTDRGQDVRAANLAAPPPAAPAEQPRPFYTRAWFWGSVAAIAAGAVVAGLVLSQRPANPACPAGVKQCF